MTTRALSQALFWRIALTTLLAGWLALWGAGQALAQGFPNRPVRLIVTYPAGGSSDLMARIMGQKLSEVWGQPVIIESKPGAAGSIGMEFAARQPADGYTFVVGNLGPAGVNPLLTKLPYSMERDFIAVALTAVGPNILVVPTASPHKSLADLLAAARAKPNTVNFGTSGPGSMSHLAGEMIMRQAGVKMTGVPYKGGGQAVNDLLAGQIDMMVSDALPVSQHIRTGRLRALAITSAKRSPLLPEVPTLDEGGVKDANVYSWQAVAAPKGLPADVKRKVHEIIVATFKEPETVAKLSELGFEFVLNSPEQFAAFQQREFTRWQQLITSRNIKAD